MIEEITKDKTAIIITHKLACAKMADRIIVMDKGKIVQDGTHETLIRQEGLYKNMYEAQAQYY